MIIQKDKEFFNQFLECDIKDNFLKIISYNQENQLFMLNY